MRITNNMIMKNSISNIGSTKEQTSKLNNQMTSQKKITKASEDPVIAIRSLRLRNSQAQINQYYKNNIPDARSWLTNTETSLTNIKKIVNDVYAQCVEGANDTLDISNRKIILNALSALRADVYSEGDSEYSGRTLFTGFKTGSTLTFTEEETATSYSITQTLSFDDMESYRYYPNQIDIPSDLTGLNGSTSIDQVTEVDQYRIRLAYDDIFTDDPAPTSLDIKMSDGSAVTAHVMSYADWEDLDFAIGDNDAYVIKETGELILGSDLAENIRAYKKDLTLTYDKTGFGKGEVRPEFYYDCVDKTDPINPVTYKYEDQQIKYTIATNTTLTVNVQAADVYSSAIGRDIDEMVSACDAAIKAQEKVDEIEGMISSPTYTNDPDAQAYLSNLLEAAQRERDYLNDNMQKLFSQGIENFQSYLSDTSNAISDVGNKLTQLELVESRMSATSSDIKALISDNEDMDLSEIVIEYTAAYNAYESALLAASKASSNTLLDYL